MSLHYIAQGTGWASVVSIFLEQRCSTKFKTWRITMFEQTFVTANAAVRKPWPMLVSVTGQVVVVGSLLMIPLWQTAQLAWKPSILVYAPPKPVPPPPQVEVVRTANRAQPSVQPVFQVPLAAPRRVPTTLNMTADDFSAPPATLGAIPSNSNSGVPSFLLGGWETTKPAVAAPPKVAESPKPKTSLLKVGGAVQAAKLIRQVKPAYPALARTARISGTVRLQAVIGTDGHIRNLLLLSGHPLLVPASIDAVMQWTYQPTLLNGEPVEVQTQIDVNFALGQ
jgi:periplasmic protein TonB